MVELVESGGAGRQLVAAMGGLDYLHDLTLYAPNTDGEMESIHLHRVVLAAASPFAKAMLKDVWKGGLQHAGVEAGMGVGGAGLPAANEGDVGVVVHLGEGGLVDIHSLRTVAAFIYTGEVRVEWGVRLLMLARVADYLGLEGLLSQCVNEVLGGIQHDNAVGMLMLVGSSPPGEGRGVEEGWMEEVREASMGYVLRHFATLSQTEGFVRGMGVRELCDVLRRDELIVEKEEVVFEAMDRWVGAVGMGRGADEAEQLLPVVRFPQMPSEYLTTHVLTCETAGVSELAALGRLVDEAMAYKEMLRAGGTTWENAPAVGHGEEALRTRRRSGYVVDAMKMKCALVMQAGDSVSCMVDMGEWVVSGHRGGSMRMWERDTWTCVKTVEQAHKTDITGMTTWKGMLVTVGNGANDVKIWEPETWFRQWNCAHVLECDQSVMYDVMVLDDSTLLTCSNDNAIWVWDTATWTCRQVVDSGHVHGAFCLAVYDGMVYCGGYCDSGHTVRVLDASTWECVDVLRGHTDLVRKLLVWQDKLMSSSHDSTIKVWSTGATPRQCEHMMNAADQVIVMCGDKLVSGGDDGCVRVWNTDTWVCERVLPDGLDTGIVTALLCTRDGQSLISGSEGDTTMRLWRGEHEHEAAAGSATAQGSGAPSPALARAPAQQGPGHVVGLDVTALKCERVVEVPTCVECIVEVGEWVVSGHDGGLLRVWDRRTWILESTLAQAHIGEVLTMTVWEGMLVTGGEDEKIKVWEPETWGCVQVLEGHTDWVRDVIVLDDRTLLSCADDSTIRVWDTSLWTCRRVVESGHSVALCMAAHNGMVYCGGMGGGTVRVFDSTAWDCVDVLRGHTNTVQQLVVWQDKIVSASKDGTIKVWSTGRVPVGDCERTLVGHTGAVLSITVCSGKLVSGGGSGDNGIRAWRTDTWACEMVLEGHHTHGVKLLLCTRGGETFMSVGGGVDKTIRMWRAGGS